MEQNLTQILNNIIDLEKQKMKLILEMIPQYYKEVNNTELNPLLFENIDTFVMTTRLKNCLKSEELEFVGDIVCSKKLYKLSTKDNWLLGLLYVPNFGERTLTELTNVLYSIGFTNFIFDDRYFLERKKRHPTYPINSFYEY